MRATMCCVVVLRHAKKPAGNAKTAPNSKNRLRNDSAKLRLFLRGPACEEVRASAHEQRKESARESTGAWLEINTSMKARSNAGASTDSRAGARHRSMAFVRVRRGRSHRQSHDESETRTCARESREEREQMRDGKQLPGMGCSIQEVADKFLDHLHPCQAAQTADAIRIKRPLCTAPRQQEDEKEEFMQSERDHTSVRASETCVSAV